MSEELGLLGFDADDPDAWVVLADALAARGDPRGELLTLARRAAQAPADAELDGALRRLRVRLLPRYVAQLPPAIMGRWREGVLYELALAEVPGSESLADQCGAALASEAAVALSRADLSALAPTCALELLAQAPRPALRSLVLGDGRAPLPELTGLWPRLPGLRELELRGPGLDLSQLRPLGPRLLRLRLALELDARPLAGLDDAGLDVLACLELQLGGDRVFEDDPVAALAPVLRSSALPGLARLRVAGVRFEPGVLNQLLRAPLLARVRELELHDDDLAPGALAAIEDPALAPPTLELLRLRACELPSRELTQLQASWGARVDAAGCRTAQ